MESALEGELDAHLVETRGAGISNRRNGKTSKQVQTSSDSFELLTPRDRDGSFEPEIVKKRQTALNESLDNKVLALYVLGMSYEAISEHLSEMYGVDVSSAKISLITDQSYSLPFAFILCIVLIIVKFMQPLELEVFSQF